MFSELVSVVIPTYNRADLLKECVFSTIRQTYRPLEILVVDDGSTDHTNAVIEDIQTQVIGETALSLRQITVSNGGAPRARNIGTLESKGTWIQYLDSDDLLLPHKIENSLKAAQKEDADLVYSQSQYLSCTNQRVDRFLGRPLDGSDRDYFEFSWQTMCPLYSRKAIERIGLWNEDLTMYQDWEFCVRGVLSGLKIHFLDQVGSLYRVHGDGNIGSNISVEKNKSREAALWSIYTLLDNKNLLSPYLVRRFRTRLMHVLLYYCQLSDFSAASSLIKEMQQQRLLGQIQASLLRLFPMGAIARIVLRLYHA